MRLTGSLAKPASIAQGSGRKPILRFVPTAGILQSNQIAERAITTYRHLVKTADFIICEDLSNVAL